MDNHGDEMLEQIDQLGDQGVGRGSHLSSNLVILAGVIMVLLSIWLYRREDRGRARRLERR